MTRLLSAIARWAKHEDAVIDVAVFLALVGAGIVLTAQSMGLM